MTNYRVLCFGASLTYGAWDEEGGWPDRLKRELHSQALASGLKPKYQLFNLGIGGATSQDLLDRMEGEIVPRIGNGWSHLHIISIGTNNARIADGQKEFEHSLEKYRDHLQLMINISRKYTEKILLTELSPLGREVVQFKGYSYHNQRVAEMNQVINKVAHQEKIPVVKIFDNAIKNSDYMESFVDDLHPNQTGHKWIFEQVKPQVLKIIES